MSRLSFAKRAASYLGTIAAIGLASTGIAGALSAHTRTADKSAVVADATRPSVIRAENEEEDDLGVGPGVHRLWQRPLTGLEIAQVRTTKRSYATGRMARSKYLPNGISARATKDARKIIQLVAAA